MTELIERDVIVGEPGVPAPAGGADAACRDCGTRVALDVRGVREYGRRPTAVVLCPPCADNTRQGIAPKKAGAAAQGALLEAIQRFAEGVAPHEIQTFYDFDPPEAGEAIQASVKELADRWVWDWTNDLGTPVLMTLRQTEGALPRQVMIPHGERFRAETPKMPPAPGLIPRPRRPVRDDPQA